MSRFPTIRLHKWFLLVAAAVALLFSSTGVANRHLEEVPTWEIMAAWAVVIIGLYLLYLFEVFAKPYRILYLFLTVALLNVFSQATGGVESPIGLSLFIILSLAAWNGRVKLELGGAALYSGLEALAYHSAYGALEPHLYLRWSTFMVFAFLLGAAVKVRSEKDRLEQRLETLVHEAGHLAQNEPSSIDLPKDELLKEETRFSARMGTVMELEDSLTRILTLFRHALGLHTTACFLITPIQGKTALRLRAHSSVSNVLAVDVVLSPGETLVGLAAKEGRRILLNDVAPESARALPYYFKPNPVKCFLAEPLTLSNPAAVEESELVGVLVFDSLEEVFFTPERLQLVEALVRVVAEAIQSVRILHFSSTKTRNLHALYKVSERYSAVISPDEVIRTALQTAKDIFPCESAYVALASDDGRSFDVKAWWGTRTELSSANGQPAQLEGELATWIWTNKKPIRYTKGRKDKSLDAFIQKEGALGAIQSFLMVPLISGENVLGVMRLNSHQPDVYQAWDEDVLSTLANQAATALEKAFLVQQMEEMAIRDGLTGLYNHRYFQEQLEEEIAKAERYNKDLSLLMMDVDHFKKFNDTFGHPEGDRVLKTVAKILQEVVRYRVDTVARYGGEEFAIILPESDTNVAFETAERVRKKIENHLFENSKGGVYRVTVSLGLASYPFDARTPSHLIHAADTALYGSKSQGRNRIIRFQEVKK